MFAFFRVFAPPPAAPGSRQPSLHCQLHTLCMYMYSILLFYCFLLKNLSTNPVGESSGLTMDRLVAFFGRFSMIFRETFAFCANAAEGRARRHADGE